MMNEIKERPIIFTAESIRAILDHRKVQTRRVIKLLEFQQSESKKYNWMFRDKNYLWNEVSTERLIEKWCPYGKVGDHLWVRETWAECKHVTINGSPTALYKSTYIQPSKFPEFTPKWRPSIFMPRWASRIDLEITGLRAERIQNITEEDAIAEGIEQKEPNNVVSAKYRFAQLWDSINAKRGFGWDKNPFVWVIEFKMI
jgi:hypothetical protein